MSLAPGGPRGAGALRATHLFSNLPHPCRPTSDRSKMATNRAPGRVELEPGGAESSRVEPGRAGPSVAEPGRGLASRTRAGPGHGQLTPLLPQNPMLWPEAASLLPQNPTVWPEALQRQVVGFSRWGWWATLFFRLFLCFVPSAQIGQTR